MDPNSSAVNDLNGPPSGGIPRISRNRVLILVGIAVAIGVVVAVIAWQSAGSESAADKNTKPLAGLPIAVIDLPGSNLPASNQPVAVAAAARRLLPAGDVRVQVAHLLATDTMSRRQATIDALQALPQSSVPVVMGLGVAQLWAGQVHPAVATFEKVKRMDPYGFYGTQADNLLNFRDYPGYPSYVLPGRPPNATLAQLKTAVKGHPADAQAWVNLAWKLQSTDRAAAIVAARRAQALAPASISAQVVASVLSFDKDNPTKALQGLMTTARAHPKNAQIAYHAGLLWFWMRDSSDAIGEMRQVIAEAPHSSYAKAAEVFVACLSDPNGAACRTFQGK
jgi:tetratricopeptide (TPR) repeat protein